MLDLFFLVDYNGGIPKLGTTTLKEFLRLINGAGKRWHLYEFSASGAEEFKKVAKELNQEKEAQELIKRHKIEYGPHGILIRF